MSAHVLLNLLSSWGKEIKCEACEFYKFNNTRAHRDFFWCPQGPKFGPFPNGI